ncbi:MAG: hypothetical protein JST84_11200 [Acidobacteria bacterium]|nr:hypothetical protein [Acidobacteriota bacterium]
MIIWGMDSDVKHISGAGLNHCETCERKRPFNVILQYRFAYLYYIFAWVTSKQYFLTCEVCQRGWKLNQKTVEANLEQNPIPFLHRYGWSFLVGLVALFVISTLIHG